MLLKQIRKSKKTLKYLTLLFATSEDGHTAFEAGTKKHCQNVSPATQESIEILKSDFG